VKIIQNNKIPEGTACHESARSAAAFKPVVLFFCCACLTVIALFVARNLKFGEYREGRYTAFSVRFEYYGMDAREMERLITIPLEEKTGLLKDLREIRSTAEYGKSTTTLFFDRGVNKKNTYLGLRDVVDTLYTSLPAAVQKPRIYSSAAESKAVLSLALTAETDLDLLRRFAENDLKKQIESFDSVAEVIVSGGRIPEVRVEFDPEKMALSGISPTAIGLLIQEANVISPGGKWEAPRGRETRTPGLPSRFPCQFRKSLSRYWHK
jgi:HAE1 family hydrophobic/amphiphilic exporter-1